MGGAKSEATFKTRSSRKAESEGTFKTRKPKSTAGSSTDATFKTRKRTVAEKRGGKEERDRSEATYKTRERKGDDSRSVATFRTKASKAKTEDRPPTTLPIPSWMGRSGVVTLDNEERATIVYSDDEVEASDAENIIEDEEVEEAEQEKKRKGHWQSEAG